MRANAVWDVNHDGRPDVATSSAHNRGVWWFEHLADGGFTRHLIDETISETHSLIVAKFGRPAAMNIVTGKRFYAHPPGVDVGSDEPAWLVRYELNRTAGGVEWVRHIIDEDSGVGTQFVVQDVNGDGLQDIVVSNKKGVFLFEQLPNLEPSACHKAPNEAQDCATLFQRVVHVIFVFHRDASLEALLVESSRIPATSETPKPCGDVVAVRRELVEVFEAATHISTPQNA